MRIEGSQEERLGKMARRLGRSPSETSAMLVEEGLRRSEFAFMDFGDTPAGRHAFIQGTRLSVWMTVKIGRRSNGGSCCGRRRPHSDRVVPESRTAKKMRPTESLLRNGLI